MAKRDSIPVTSLTGGGIPVSSVSRGAAGVRIPGASGSGSKKPKRWFGALVENLEDFAKGIPAGIETIARVGYNDLDRLSNDVLPGNRAKSFQSDDIAKAIGADYKRRYAPLFRGDFAGFKDQVAVNPLDFILDVATVATLGGAGVGKAGQITAKTGAAAKEGSLAAGLAKRAGYVDRTPDNLDRARLVYGGASREVRQGAKSGLVRGVREIKPPPGSLLGQPLLRPLRTNAVLRPRDTAVDRMLAPKFMANAPGVGIHSRIAREARRMPQLQRSVHQQELNATEKKVRGLTPAEMVAWSVMHEGGDVVARADRIERELPGLNDADRVLAEHRLELLRSEDVRAAIEQPSKRLAQAVEATQSYSNGTLAKVAVQAYGMTLREQIERRLLPQRLEQGAEMTDRHPEQLQPTDAAKRAQRVAIQEEAQRGRRRMQVDEDLARLQKDRQRLSARLVLLANKLRGQVRRQDDDRRFVAAADEKVGQLSEQRVVGHREVAGEKPEPGPEPSAVDVEQMLADWRRRVIRTGKWKDSEKHLRQFVEQVYDRAIHQTSTPSKAQRLELTRERGGAKRRSERRKVGQIPDLRELQKLLDSGNAGPWSPQVVRLIERSGGEAKRYWSIVRKERAADAKFVDAYPAGSLDRYVARAGFHPGDRLANPAEGTAAADELADAVGEWLDEQVETSIADVARGVRHEGDVFDQQSAQALLARARRGDPDLDPNASMDDIAEAIALDMLPDDRAASIPSRAEFTDRIVNAMMRVVERNFDELADPGTEFGKLRGSAAHVLADELGIRNADLGVEPTGADWARAIKERVREAGFDDDYLEAIRPVAKAEDDFRELGAWHFRDDRFVPDPDNTTLEAVLEFVPEIDPALRAKLVAGATSLTAAERRTLQQVASKLEAAARRVEKNGSSEAVLRSRHEGLAQPGARERRARARAEEQENVPLRGLKTEDADGREVAYNKQEPVNPDTNLLHKDENLELSDEAYAELAEGAAYRSHMAPAEGRGGGGLQAPAASKRAPGKPSNVTHSSTGQRLVSGTDDVTPQGSILRIGEAAAQAAHADALYQATLPWGTKFDLQTFLEAGGQDKVVIMDTKGVKNLNGRVSRLESQVDQLDDLIGFERHADLVEKLSGKASELAALGDTDGLVMVPRALYEKIVGDLHQSNIWVQRLIDRPLDVFRTLVLFSRGGYYVNNIVGQNFMLAVRDGGPKFLPAYVKFLASRNANAARQLFGAATTDPRGYELWRPVIDKYGGPLSSAAAGVVETSGLRGSVQRMGLSPKRSHRAVAAMLRSPATANELMSILSDDLTRQFLFIRKMQPHVKAARADGFDGEDADIAMRLLDEDPVLHERMIAETLFDLVDYRSMSKFEKGVMRRVIPFYGWLRGISTWTAELGYNHPEQLYALAQISNVGQRENADFAARTPLWMGGALRVGAEKDGVQRVVNTAGLNPLGTVGELASIARLMTSDRPSQSLANGTTFGVVNPYAQALLAALNQGKKIGTPYKMLMPGQTLNAALVGKENQLWRGVPGTALGGFIASTPQNQLYVNWLAQRRNEQAGLAAVANTTGVYQSPFRDYLLSYAGLPVRNVNMAAAQARREQDDALLAGEGRGY